MRVRLAGLTSRRNDVKKYFESGSFTVFKKVINRKCGSYEMLKLKLNNYFLGTAMKNCLIVLLILRNY